VVGPHGSLNNRRSRNFRLPTPREGTMRRSVPGRCLPSRAADPNRQSGSQLQRQSILNPYLTFLTIPAIIGVQGYVRLSPA
jgi:hypothetical protein